MSDTVTRLLSALETAIELIRLKEEQLKEANDKLRTTGGSHLAYQGFTTLRELRAGALFRTEDGILACCDMSIRI